MPAKLLYSTYFGALLWLSRSQKAWALNEPRAASDSPSPRYAQHIALLSKRNSAPKTTYIAIVVAVVGTALLVTIGICWDLHRRRRASKLRQMEEARHPREPISYDHFPVEPGEASEHSEVGASVIHPPNSVMSASSSRYLTLPPSVVAGSGPLPLSSSFNSAPRSLSESPEYAYDENTLPPPPFSADTPRRLVPPPGLEDHHTSSGGTQTPNDSAGSHVPSRHALPLTQPPSRPPTASAPPAYSPSDPESIRIVSARVLGQDLWEGLSGSQHSLASSHPGPGSMPAASHQGS